mmetsp:Transcript_15140/g.20895  ORF Transcript_15140/g.20895 Transcript_15140/m.20895 type:complete len:229 (+) Transcript_15140:130-816(+)
MVFGSGQRIAGLWLAVFTLCYVVCDSEKAQTDLRKRFVGTSNVRKITEENFDDEIARGPYYVKVYADWCSHCKIMAPAWEAMADELDEVFVGQINGPEEKALVARLGVKGYPSIFLFRDGSTWEYTGNRELKLLTEFAVKDYKFAKPLPFYKAPNSVVGRAFGLVTSFPLTLEKAYHTLHEKQGFSHLSIISCLLLVPVVIGVAFVVFLDISTSRAQPINQENRPHAE